MAKKEYTPSEIKDTLKELGIEPFKTHLVTGQQATKILTWRLRTEKGVESEYTMTALRRRVSTGSLRVTEQVNTQLNLYDVRDIFELSLVPQRAEGTKRRQEKERNATSTPC